MAMGTVRAAMVALPLLIAGLLHADPAQAGSRQTAVVIYSENPAERALQIEYGYSDAVVTADGTVYLSGVVVGLPPGDTDIEAAFTRAYQRIGDTLLRAGATWEDVVDVTSFHTDLTSQIETMSRVHKRHIAPPYSAWTAIQVSRLFPDRGIAEIKIVAKKSAD